MQRWCQVPAPRRSKRLKELVVRKEDPFEGCKECSERQRIAEINLIKCPSGYTCRTPGAVKGLLSNTRRERMERTEHRTTDREKRVCASSASHQKSFNGALQ